MPSEHHPEMHDNEYHYKDWKEIPPGNATPPATNRTTSGKAQQMTIIHIIPELPFPL